jgi:hypothetical protein
MTRLDEGRGVVHAFLPTLEGTGFAFKINGDVSTDPSRTRVILDARTATGIGAVARLIVDLVGECLAASSAPANAKLLAALMPISDPRMACFQRRGFKTELYAAVKREANGRFDNFLCRPQWLNAGDFSKLATASGGRAVPRNFEGVEGLPGFLKFLGAREASLKDLAPGLTSVAPSLSGAAEVVAHLTNLHATKQIQSKDINPSWKLWPVDAVALPLDEASTTGKPLASDFMALVAEKLGSVSELTRMLAALTSPAIAAKLFPDKPPDTPQPAQAGPAGKPTSQQVSLKRWRGAEQQVFTVLEAWGWRVTDVSRQNLGYDIEGRTPEGEDVFIEVKSLDYPGQPFTLTSNEEAVARQKGGAYRLALVRQTNAHLEIAFIPDPVNQLKLARQCRQWVWECSTYDYAPERFPLE